MKDQFFGDSRDYFKYDLMIFLADNLQETQRFTFIPMLTANDKSGQGAKTGYKQMKPDTPGLYDFLRRCIREERRSVAQLRTFFGQHDGRFEYCPYWDDRYFQNDKRGPYFAELPSDYLDRALVLADPDTGLEISSMRPSNAHNYIRYDEVKGIYRRLGLSSVFLIFQYFPRVQRAPYLRRRFQEICSALQWPPPIAISDNQIAFIALTKSNETRSSVSRLLREYVPRNLSSRVFGDSTSP